MLGTPSANASVRSMSSPMRRISCRASHSGEMPGIRCSSGTSWVRTWTSSWRLADRWRRRPPPARRCQRPSACPAAATPRLVRPPWSLFLRDIEDQDLRRRLGQLGHHVVDVVDRRCQVSVLRELRDTELRSPSRPDVVPWSAWSEPRTRRTSSNTGAVSYTALSIGGILMTCRTSSIFWPGASALSSSRAFAGWVRSFSRSGSSSKPRRDRHLRPVGATMLAQTLPGPVELQLHVADQVDIRLREERLLVVALVQDDARTKARTG